MSYPEDDRSRVRLVRIGFVLAAIVVVALIGLGIAALVSHSTSKSVATRTSPHHVAKPTTTTKPPSVPTPPQSATKLSQPAAPPIVPTSPHGSPPFNPVEASANYPISAPGAQVLARRAGAEPVFCQVSVAGTTVNCEFVGALGFAQARLIDGKWLAGAVWH